jgi:hypothetical protein
MQAAWPRVLVALGGVALVVGLGLIEAIDAAAQAHYLLFVGVLLVATGLIGALVQRVLRFRNALRLPHR